MKSKTSFFNLTVFRGNFTRFWPIWALYAGIMLIMMPVLMGNEMQHVVDAAGRLNIDNAVLGMGQISGAIMAFAVGIIAAMMIFSYLYTAKSAGMYASLPVSRGSMFVTNYLSGIIIYVALNIIIAVITLFVEACNGCANLGIILQWLAITTLQYIFFYSLAVFSAVLTGHIIALPLLYLVFNFVVMLVKVLLSAMLDMFIYGYSAAGFDVLSPASPLPYMISNTGTGIYVEKTGEYVDYISNDLLTAVEDCVARFSGWGLLWAYALVGIALAAIGYFIFRRRQMESASDFIAVKWVKPIFKYAATLCCAFVIGIGLYYVMFADMYLSNGSGNLIEIGFCMLIGGFIGYFAAEMILQKSFKVFKKNWLGYIISMLVVIAVLLCIKFDVFGYEKRVPEVDNVKSASVSAEGESYVEFKEEENIKEITDIHRSIIDHKEGYEQYNRYVGESSYVRIEYTLKNGDVISRVYYVPTSDELLNDETADAYALNEILNSKEAIAYRKSTDIEIKAENISYSTVCYYDPETGEYTDMGLTPEQAEKLYKEGIAKDLANGDIGRIYLNMDDEYYNSVYDCDIYIGLYEPKEEYENSNETQDAYSGGDRYYSEEFYTHPTVDSKYTLECLRELGIKLNTIHQVQQADEQSYGMESSVAVN